VTHQLPDDIVPMLFPANGAETRWTQGLTAYLQTVQYNALQDCARSYHIAAPNVPPPMFVRYLDIPDLAFIRVHGFSADTATGAGPPDETPSAAQRQCLAAAADADRALRASVTALQAQWFAALSTIREQPPVAAAYRDFTACLGQRGLAVSDENDFFTLVDSRLHHLDGQPAREPTEHELAAHYVACTQPVEAVREPQRQRLRHQFVAGHAGQVTTLRSSLVPQLRDLEKRLGTPISFPAV